MGAIYGYISNGIANIDYKDNDNKFLNSKELIICIDGEIENKEDICKKFNIENNSDVEIIKELYIKYGENFIEKIEGFFAIGIYDKQKNKLILIRDKIGLKQLYYYIKDNSIYFASELKSIIKYPEFEKEINYDALSMYFRYSHINPPETIFKNTYKLEHGHYIIWQNGEIKNRTYWDGIEKFNILSQEKLTNFEQAKQGLTNIIKEYLEKTVKNNDDFGVYLSGGVDSSLVTAMCSEISKKPINTFSIGFYEEERNEAENAKKIAKYLKTNHHEIYINKDELLKVIKKIPEYYDEPFSDSSEIPTIILNEFASKNKIKIAITGDGADQLFCGSTIYDIVDKIQKAYKIFNPFNLNLKLKIIKNTRLCYIYANSDKRNHAQTNISSKEKLIKGLFKDNGEKRYNIEDKIDSKSWQEKRMMVDINTFLANRINTKINKASVKNSIEIKSPFLENKLIEYSFKIPQEFKYYKKQKKYILKQILYDYIPKDFFDSKKKGFGIPIKKWLTTYLYEDFMKVSSKEFIEKQNIFNYEKLNKLIKKINNKRYPKKISQVLWDFYMFQLWYIKYMEKF